MSEEQNKARMREQRIDGAMKGLREARTMPSLCLLHHGTLIKELADRQIAETDRVTGD